MNANGTIQSGTAESGSVGSEFYQVIFPGSVAGCTAVATVGPDDVGGTTVSPYAVPVVYMSGASAVGVEFYNAVSQTLVLTDFHLIVIC